MPLYSHAREGASRKIKPKKKIDKFQEKSENPFFAPFDLKSWEDAFAISSKLKLIESVAYLKKIERSILPCVQICLTFH